MKDDGLDLSLQATQIRYGVIETLHEEVHRCYGIDYTYMYSHNVITVRLVRCLCFSLLQVCTLKDERKH